MDEYGQLLPYFEGWMQQGLAQCPVYRRKDVREIRVRLGQPLAVVLPKGVHFIRGDGSWSQNPDGCRRVTGDEITACLRRVCGYSMQSCERELAQGFCTLRGGHRVGVAGTVAAEDGKILNLREAGSLNFRIARQVFGAAENLPQEFYRGGRIPSVLLAGPPGSGKTTILRDLIRRLSMGECGSPLQIAAIDERGELGGGRDLGEACLDLGPCTDLLSGYPKGTGMEIALRTLSPQILACDELGSRREISAVLESVHAGVALLATVHGDSLAALQKRPALRGILAAGVFDVVVFLRDGAPVQVARLDEVAGA